MKHFLLALAIVLGMCWSSQATVILNQNWDDIGTYSPGVTGNIGDPATTDGRWGPFDASSVIGISNTVANSGSQSAIITRGGSMIGRVDTAVSTSEFEISYSIYRASSDSELIVQTGDVSTIGTDADLATFTRANGVIHYWNGAGWTGTTGSAAVGEWTKIRLLVDTSGTPSYDLFVTPEGGSEAFIQTVTLAGLPASVNAMRLNPQGLAGTVTYFDDAFIAEIPEPATLALTGLGGLLLFRRNRCN